MSEIIQAVFTPGKTFVKTESQWRYNKGQKLQIFGLDLPEYFEAHFSNKIDGTAKKVFGQDGIVSVPPEYFVSGENIYCWLYIQEGEAHVTKCQIRIPLYDKGELTDEEPTPEQESIVEQAIALLNAATANIPSEINAALEAAKESGEFDGKNGKDGSGIWYTTARISGGENPFARRRNLIGREGATVQVHDLLFAPDVGDEGEPTTLYEITSVGTACELNRLCKMQGEDGTSPTVTITEITGGHRITITDEAHPDGQSFDVMDGQGGGSGTSDYSELTNKPQIAGVTLSGNKSLADLGIAAASDIPTVPVQSVNGKTGAVVLNASDVGAGTYSKPSGGIPKTDFASAVQTSLGKADTALQIAVTSFNGSTGAVTYTAPVTSVNSQTGAVSLPIPATASDVGAVAVAQGVAHAGEFVVVGSDGNVTTKVQTEEVTVSTAGDVTQALDPGKIYHFTGSLTALTLTLNAAEAGQQAQYHFDFLSGATAPTVTIPASVTMPDGWTVEANMRYEIDILDGYGVAQSWEVTA